MNNDNSKLMKCEQIQNIIVITVDTFDLLLAAKRVI